MNIHQSDLWLIAELQRLHHGHQAAKEFPTAKAGRKIKGNMDIELTVNAMELAPHVDHIVLFSGDGDFRPMVESVQRQGVRVSVVSTIRSQRRR